MVASYIILFKLIAGGSGRVAGSALVAMAVSALFFLGLFFLVRRLSKRNLNVAEALKALCVAEAKQSGSEPRMRDSGDTLLTANLDEGVYVANVLRSTLRKNFAVSLTESMIPGARRLVKTPDEWPDGVAFALDFLPSGAWLSVECVVDMKRCRLSLDSLRYYIDLLDREAADLASRLRS